MNEVIRWEFPLTRVSTGMLLGNGVAGAVIWGQENLLRVTLSRADYWDHGSYSENPEQSTPVLLPMGRLELVFPKDTLLKTGYLHLKNGKVAIDLTSGQHAGFQVTFHMSMDKPVINVHIPPGKEMPEIKMIPAWEIAGEPLRERLSEEPVYFTEQSAKGWIQARHEDPPVCVASMVHSTDIYVSISYGYDCASARKNAIDLLEISRTAGPDSLRTATAHWWADFWKHVPMIELPGEALSHLYYYGFYKFAGMTAPGGVLAPLQGPWMDDSRIPAERPYKFDSSIPLCYMPALRSNLSGHMEPLFALVSSWMPALKKYAADLLGISDGVLLPGFVDDRCRLTREIKAIDGGATTRVALLMFSCFQFTQDKKFLRNTAHPFMKAAFNSVYKIYSDGNSSSFVLASLHYLARSCIQSANTLNEEENPLWKEVIDKVPEAGFFKVLSEDGVEQVQIGLREGEPLNESSCDQGFLAGIFPFDTIDIDSPQWKRVAENTLINWIGRGMGKWAGWCFPLASMIHTRYRNSDMAELLLELWQRLFTNDCSGTMQDPKFAGFTVYGSLSGKSGSEIMRMDGAMAAVSAIMEMMLHTRCGVNYLFWGIPSRWKSVSFENMRTEGAFEVSASRQNGRVVKVVVRANEPGSFRLANPWAANAILSRQGSLNVLKGTVLEFPLSANERVELTGE